jgi:hypothetical protein
VLRPWEWERWVSGRVSSKVGMRDEYVRLDEVTLLATHKLTCYIIVIVRQSSLQ